MGEARSSTIKQEHGELFTTPQRWGLNMQDMAKKCQEPRLMNRSGLSILEAELGRGGLQLLGLCPTVDKGCRSTLVTSLAVVLVIQIGFLSERCLHGNLVPLHTITQPTMTNNHSSMLHH